MQQLKNQHIVCVAFPKWEGDYMKSTVQLMTELALHNQVLYVDYAYTWKDFVQAALKGDWGLVFRMLNWKPSLREIKLENKASIQLLTLPPFIPANWITDELKYDRLLKWNAEKARKRILSAMQQLNIQNPIVVNAFNPALGVALEGQLNEQHLVYYCYDEISAAPWIGKHAVRYEQQLMQKADLTIVSSAELYKEKSKMATNCGLVKNGVGPLFFGKPAARPADMPANDIIIGYLGSVDSRLDIELLEQVAQSFENSQLVFVGRVVEEAYAKRLGQYSNVTILGSKSPAELKDYVAAFDVCLIPFVCNRLTAGIYPLKANEYLALGKPVVSTDFSDLSDFEEVIYIASEITTFCEKIEQALSENAQSLASQRRVLAEGNTWEARARDFGKLIIQMKEPIEVD